MPLSLSPCSGLGLGLGLGIGLSPQAKLSMTFLDASSHLYKPVCPSVRPSVCPSVRMSVRMSVRHKLSKMKNI